ncbi:MAG: hypothetical protein EpisKO_42320 [Epibacterium sp.]
MRGRRLGCNLYGLQIEAEENSRPDMRCAEARHIGPVGPGGGRDAQSAAQDFVSWRSEIS